MKTLFLFCIVILFIVFQFGMAQIAIKTQSNPDVVYLFVFNVTDSSFESYTPVTDFSETHKYNDKTIFRKLDGSFQSPNKGNIETHGGYKFTTFSESNNNTPDTLEQVFLIGNVFGNLELNFGIINTISENSDLKKLNNTEYILSSYKN